MLPDQRTRPIDKHKFKSKSDFDLHFAILSWAYFLSNYVILMARPYKYEIDIDLA